jgi:transposase
MDTKTRPGPKRRLRQLDLSHEQICFLTKACICNEARSSVRLRAKILLELRYPAYVEDVAARVGCNVETVRTMIKRFEQHLSILDAVYNRPRSRIVTRQVEAKLVELAHSTPTDGYPYWSYRRMARSLVDSCDIPPLSHQTVGEVMRKHGINLQNLEGKVF